jgi:PhnB protein
MDNLSLIEEVDQAVEALLAHPEVALAPADADVASLLSVAAELCNLPREEFRTELKKDLERRITMTTQAQTAATEPDSTPAAFQTVIPYLTVANVHEEIAFIREVFGGEGQIYGLGSAGGFHSEFKIGGAMLMIGGGGEGSTWKGTPSLASLHIYVEDVDAVYERAVQAGATALHQPMDQEYGERSAGFMDPSGNHWYPAKAKGEHYILEGAQSLMPYLHPRGAERQIEFLQQAFGAEEMFRHASPEGIIYHAKVKVGNSIVEMGEAHDQWQPMPGTFMVYVDDVDASYAQAMRANGAVSMSGPADKPYGDRVAVVKDPFDNTWYLAKHIGESA